MNKIKINYCREDLTSRIPGLFPYIDFDDTGVCHLHRSTESESGCYGQIVPALVIPEGVTLSVDGKDLVESGKSYTYRTLIKYYYKYKDLDSTFINFFRHGIGRFQTYGYDEECDLVPEYEYYANAHRLYNEYFLMKTAVDNYNAMKDISGIDCEMECIAEKFRRMGGEYMMEFYRERSLEANGMAETYYGYADLSATCFNANINIVSTENDLGFMTTYLDYWDPKRDCKAGELVVYDDSTFICTQDTEGGSGVWDEDTETYVFDYTHFTKLTSSVDLVELQGTTDSKLKGFRASRTYVSADGKYEEPETGEDWLWYYKVGDIAFYESATDTLGNIVMLDGKTRNTTVGEYDDGLMCYGNVMLDITVDPSERTVTFEYVIGAHLKGKLTSITVDDYNETIYCYTDFTYDEDDVEHGVQYVETYPYNEYGELDLLMNNNPSMFNKYIWKVPSTKAEMSEFFNVPNYFDNEVTYNYLKCSFDTSAKTATSTAEVNGRMIVYNYIMTDYTASVRSDSDTLYNQLTKHDWFVGITYDPKVNSDVYINRGNAASWERHMKLGEVKTFDDLMDYSNGGFFNVVE